MPMEVGVQRGASSPVEYDVNLEVELQKVCDGILALMDESLILSAKTGEPREFCYEVKGDYYRFLVGVSMVSQRQAPTIQKERKTVEVSQVQYIDEIIKRVEEILQVMTQEMVVPVRRPYPEYVDVPYANPIVQTVEKTVEVPRVQYIDWIVDLPVVMQRQIPTIQAVQVTVEVTHVQFIDPAVDVPAVMQRQGPPETSAGAHR